MRILCRLGLHDYEYEPPKKVTHPRRGEFDPRTDAQRTWEEDWKVCVHCGKRKQFEHSYGYGDL
jgi:hypothetical protein